MHSTMLAIVMAMLVAGCTSYIPAPIRSAPPDSPPLAVVRDHPNDAVGKTVRWGGILAKVDNQQTETWVEIVDKSLGWNGAPLETDKSQGRFIARIAGFLDPIIYERGRRLTILGTIEPAVTHRIGDFTYLFPVVLVSEHHLWAPEPDIVYYEPWPIWHDPWYPRPFPYHYGPPFYYY